ncbi:MAG: isochorismatase family protein [Planctomycetota bacterium]|nr:isochorismatase family protein [Planctomycetota bacterium]MCX8040630.1 isochorismatase family protein [Planctomycetota bacterium]MDW8372374.1 isochorismatase family protein [Planctomycetota bacterium]
MAPFDLAADNSALLLIDVQERFLPAIPEIAGERPVGRCCRLLLESARDLAVPILVSEQYPQGLGPTLAHLQEALAGAPRHPKTAFSCCRDAGLARAIAALHRSWWVLAGIEAHVCVLATAADLLAQGRRVVIAADAVASRDARHAAWALQAARDLGALALPAETVIFAWLGDAAHPAFKRVAARLR